MLGLNFGLGAALFFHPLIQAVQNTTCSRVENIQVSSTLAIMALGLMVLSH
jgi:hypothetical protein